MKKQLLVMTIILIIALTVGCTTNQEEPFSTLLSYKNSYVGDATAVAGIIAELPGRNAYSGIMLHTSDKPYGITIKYDITKEGWVNENEQNLMMYNAASLFALIHNVDTITFLLEADKDREVHFLRSEIEVLMDKDWAYYYDDPLHWEEGLYKTLYLEESQ